MNQTYRKYLRLRAVGLLMVAGGAQGADQAAVDPTESVVVTGTHIRGAEPVGSRLITITQEEIQAGGFTRIEEVVRALPQNFGGGPREDTYVQQGTGDRATSTNAAKGTTVNFRGLGAGTTLILVNGRRLSPSGTAGLFTDISNLPLAAIERIEVLTDGASALYGSDAVGGVVNVIMRKDYRGAQTAARIVSGAGDTQDYHLNQSFGTAWGSGTANVSYEFVKRDGLRASSRAFSRNIDQRARGGDDFRTPGGNPGVVIVGGRTWSIPANQDGRNLTAADLVPGTVNYRNESDFLWLLPGQERQGTAAFVSQDLGERVKVWVQGVGGRQDSESVSPWYETLMVPSSNPFYVNPAGGTGPVTVRYDLTEDFGLARARSRVDMYNAVGGVQVDIGAGWQLNADYAYGEEQSSRRSQGVNRSAIAAALADPNPETAFNPFGDGAHTNPSTIDTFRSISAADTVSALGAANVLAEGPILSWRAGDIRLAMGAEDRKYEYDSLTRSYGASVTRTAASASRRINAFFGELRVPLVGAGNRFTGAHELTLSASVRREEYSDFGHSNVPKFGVDWSPVTWLRLRASWSESFRAPDLSSLDETMNNFTLVDQPDPLSPTGTSQVLRWSGGNAQLLPETADTLTVGMDFKPPQIPGLRFGVSYFDIDYVNRIQAPFSGGTITSVLGDPTYSRFVIRDPSQQLREQVCASGTPTDANREACLTEPIAAIIDMRVANTAKLRTDGIDMDVRYQRQTANGDVSFGLLATRIFDYEQATTANLPLVSLLNQKYRPVDTRLRASASWRVGELTATGFVNYVDDYQDVSTTQVRRIGSWTTLDADLHYALSSGRGPWSGLSFSLNAQNLMDKDPPFVNTMFGYDILNSNPYGRVVSLLVQKQW